MHGRSTAGQPLDSFEYCLFFPLVVAAVPGTSQRSALSPRRHCPKRKSPRKTCLPGDADRMPCRVRKYALTLLLT